MKENNIPLDPEYIESWLNEHSNFTQASIKKISSWANGVNEGKKFKFKEGYGKEFTIDFQSVITRAP